MNASTVADDIVNNAAGIPSVKSQLEHCVGQVAGIISQHRNVREATDKCLAELVKSFLELMNGPNTESAKLVLDQIKGDRIKPGDYTHRFIRHVMVKQNYSNFTAGMKRDALKLENNLLVAMRRLQDVWPAAKRPDLVPTFMEILTKVREADQGYGGVVGLVSAYNAKRQADLNQTREKEEEDAKKDEAAKKAAHMAALNITSESVYEDYIKNQQAIEERNRAVTRINEWLSLWSSIKLPFGMKDDGIYIMFQGVAVKVPLSDLTAMSNAIGAMETYTVKSTT